jgi:hypothetical protein
MTRQAYLVAATFLAGLMCGLAAERIKILLNDIFNLL